VTEVLANPIDVEGAAGTNVTLTVYAQGDVVLVVPRDVAPVVNLLPHSLRSVLFKAEDQDDGGCRSH
jgi:hypothetical protein